MLPAAPCGVSGVGCVFENNTVAWSPFCNLGIYGQYHVIRGNRILWGGNSGVGGCSIGLRFEKNYLAYNGWRNFDPNWHGGAVKLIPANVDHVMRDNEVCYNCLSGIWYDTENQGNLIEWNHCHDNATIGLFDEFSFDNTFQHNLVYNNEGTGLGICNSSEDTAYRNIFYNNNGTGVFFRWDAPHPRCSPAEYEQNKADTGVRIEVRRFQGLIPYQREKLFRDFVEKYTWWYPEGTIVAKSRVLENVIFNNWGWGGVEINQPVHYSAQGKVEPELVNTFDGNIYWNPFSTRIFTNGSYCQPELDLAQWQRALRPGPAQPVVQPAGTPRRDARVVQEAVSLQARRHAADPPGAHRDHPLRKTRRGPDDPDVAGDSRPTHRADPFCRPCPVRTVFRRRRRALDGLEPRCRGQELSRRRRGSA